MGRFVLLSLVLLVPGVAAADVIVPKFAIDPASPSNAGGITPADVLTPGPVVNTPGSALGLQTNFPNGAFDNLTSLSYGQDPISSLLYFSVDRLSAGRPGSAVSAEAQPAVAAAAGDIFQALHSAGSNSLYLKGSALGLAPGFFGDDLDALELNARPAQSTSTYFSIGRFSASNNFGTGGLSKDILTSTGNGSFSIFTDGAASMGLNPGDQISGLVLNLGSRPGVFTPGVDMALFTLDAFSPDTFTTSGAAYQPGVKGALSPGDILFTDFTGSFTLFASAASIGLIPTDAVDALSSVVPEPSSLVLVVVGVSFAGLAGASARRP